MVIVHQCDRADHITLRRLGHFLHKLVADQVPKGLGAVGVPALGDETVELLQEIGIDSYANPAEIAHAYSIVAERGTIGREYGPVYTWTETRGPSSWLQRPRSCDARPSVCVVPLQSVYAPRRSILSS